MSDFVFQNPTKIIFGKGKISLIGDEIKNNGYKKVLLLAGGGSIKKNGVYEQTIKSLDAAGIGWVESWGVKPNPELNKTNEAIRLAKKEEVDSILAVGGGSVIDTAKTIAAGYYVDDVWKCFEGTQNIDKALPIFTILTISATGTEMNCFAVLTKEEEHKKWHIDSHLLYPKVSILDPETQFTLPWNQTANGAIDALSHIMEFYFMGTKEETALALDESLMRTIIKVTDTLKNNPSDYEARSSLAWAATLALNGISGAMLHYGDWSTHTLEHGVSAFKTDVAHGTGLAILFPAWIAYCKDANLDTFKRWAKNVWNADSVEEGVLKMKAKYAEWETPISLTEIGVKEEDLEEIRNITINRFKKFGALKQLDGEDVLEILNLAL
ncbi:iron-containing alcohol dehydrogenase [archaeon]|nr:iron-containing alcohol dehydrogenase [archaeon]MBL7057242.1 iron-containing alcohol dehydrogenase [Candidatus Woesearchaeota archaeon]